MTVLAYGGGHFVAAVSLAAIIISVIYHHYLILVSGEVLYESVNADTGRHVLLCVSECIIVLSSEYS